MTNPDGNSNEKFMKNAMIAFRLFIKPDTKLQIPHVSFVEHNKHTCPKNQGLP